MPRDWKAMLSQAQHPSTRIGAGARIATSIAGSTLMCLAVLLVLAGEAPAAGLGSVTQAASPVTQAAAGAGAPITHAATPVTQATGAAPNQAPSSSAPLANAPAPVTHTATQPAAPVTQT